MTEYECIYRAALALNNTGVCLIQHGKYMDAIATLKDAMTCTKQFCNGAILPCTMQKSECDQMLRAAWTRKSNCTMKARDRVNILVVSDQDNPSNVFSLLKQHHSALCCVTINPVERFDISDIDRLQLESAMVVYNFGIVYRCISNQPTDTMHLKNNDDSNAVSHQYAFWVSVRVMELARCVTRNLLQLSSCNRSSMLLYMPSSLLLTELIVTTNLQQMSVGNPLLFENEMNYSFDLLNVMSMVSDRERFFIAEGYDISVATAA